jgi:vacuolar-type H+-ATPase subunit H
MTDNSEAIADAYKALADALNELERLGEDIIPEFDQSNEDFPARLVGRSHAAAFNTQAFRAGEVAEWFIQDVARTYL